MSNKRKAKYEFERARNALIKDLEKFINSDVPRIKEELNEIALGTITEWYATYEPFIYKRKMSLKHAFKVTATPDLFAIDYSPEFMNDYVHHQSNEIIFNNSFIEGYHGGSRGDGQNEPRWRYPSPIKSHKPPYYRIWHPDYEYAVQTFSPYEEIEKEAQKKIDDEIQKIHDKAASHIRVMERNYSIIKGR